MTMKKLLLLCTILAAASCSPKIFSIVQIADAQLGFDAAVKGQKPGATYVNDLTYEKEYLTKAVQEINRIKPDVVVFTGDQIHLPDDVEQQENFKAIASRIDRSVKVFYLPGNHDVVYSNGNVDSTPFTDLYGEDRFVYSVPGITLLGINSNLIMYNDPSEAQLKEWMEAELAKGKAENVKLIFCHHPFFVENIDEGDGYYQIPKAKRQAYFEMFSAAGVDAIYAGHLHYGASGEYYGIPMVTTTSVAYQLGDSRPSIRLITITDGKTVVDELLEL